MWAFICFFNLFTERQNTVMKGKNKTEYSRGSEFFIPEYPNSEEILREFWKQANLNLGKMTVRNPNFSGNSSKSWQTNRLRMPRLDCNVQYISSDDFDQTKEQYQRFNGNWLQFQNNMMEHFVHLLQFPKQKTKCCM